MKEKLEEQFLHTVVLPKEKVVWIKYNREIIFENKMFDVKSFSERNGMVYFLGLFDEEETALKDLLEKDKNGEGNKQLTQLIDWLHSPCTVFPTGSYIIEGQLKVCSFPILLNIPSPFKNVLTPPPQVS